MCNSVGSILGLLSYSLGIFPVQNRRLKYIKVARTQTVISVNERFGTRKNLYTNEATYKLIREILKILNSKIQVSVILCDC